MNKKASDSDNILATVVPLLVVILFVIGMVFFVSSKSNGAGTWEDYYAKELSRAINYAQSGDEITVDVQIASEVAAKSKISDAKTMFDFDNVNKQVCVKLSSGRMSCYSYFAEAEVLNWRIDRAGENNILRIKIGEVKG